MPVRQRHSWIRKLMLGALLLACLPRLVAAQEAMISGQVLDAKTSRPLPGVNVFIDGTTLGAATDAEGRFSFQLPDLYEIELVASMIGYRVEMKRIVPSKTPGEVVFELVQEVVELETVTVEADTKAHKAWKRNLERFEELIFSTSYNGEKCRILNPEVLDLSHDEHAHILTAHARKPLEIENEILGYRIFIHDASLRGDKTLLQWGGNFQFSELASADDDDLKKWRENRMEAYRGSTRHFLTALMQGYLKAEGFSVYYVDEPGKMMKVERLEDEQDVLGGSSGAPRRVLRFPQVLWVTYHKEPEPRVYGDYKREMGLGPRSRTSQESWLSLVAGSVEIDAQGHQYGGYALVQYGYWAWERLGEQLPQDFQPEDDE